MPTPTLMRMMEEDAAEGRSILDITETDEPMLGEISADVVKAILRSKKVSAELGMPSGYASALSKPILWATTTMLYSY